MGKYLVSEVVERWVKKELRRGYPLGYLKDGTIKLIPKRGVIYSRDYGFPLAEALRDKKRNVRLFLVNGDLGVWRSNRYHQEQVRWVLRNHSDHVPHLIVPFSALEAASIDRSSIQPIEIREDRFTTIKHKVAPWDEKKIRWRQVGSEWSDWNGSIHRFQRGRIEGRSDILFERRLIRSTESSAEQQADFTVRARTWNVVHTDPQGQMYFDENRHWLGDSTFRAKVNGRYRTFVSSFDYQEPVPLYFLAEVPRGALVRTVDDAMLALSPPIVHAAVAQKREVKRQGDMFAIPTELTTEDVLTRTKGKIGRAGVFGTDHVATEVVVGKGRVTYARGTLHHRPEGRRRDHEPCSLGKTWHLMVPNAVPRRRRGMQVRAGRT